LSNLITTALQIIASLELTCTGNNRAVCLFRLGNFSFVSEEIKLLQTTFVVFKSREGEESHLFYRVYLSEVLKKKV